MTVAEQLRALDRKAGFGRQPTPEQWRDAARRWRWLMATACAQVLAVVVLVLVIAPEAAGGATLAFVALWLAYLAGRWRAEEDRLHGRDGVIGGQRRPPGL